MQVSNINFTSNLQKKSAISNPVQSVALNDETKGDTFVSKNKAKIGIGVASLGLLTVLGFLLRGKLNVVKANGIKGASAELLANPIKYILETPEEKLMPEFKEMFFKLKGHKGKEFAEKSHELISNFLGYKNIGPKLEIKPIETFNAYFVGMDGEIKVGEKYIEKANNSELLGTVMHEFTHFIQTSNIVRTQNLGPKAYIKSGAKSEIYQASKDSELRRIWFYKYDAQKLSQVEIKNYIDKCYQENVGDFNQAFYDKIIKKKGVINTNTELAKQSEEYLNALNKSIDLSAMKNNRYRIEAYDADFRKAIVEEHFKNHFEATAYKVEDKIGQIFKKFSEQNK